LGFVADALSYSVSQLTDPIPTNEANTQTILPQINCTDFVNAYRQCGINLNNITKFWKTEKEIVKQGNNTDDNDFMDNEDFLQQQFGGYLRDTLKAWDFDSNDSKLKILQPYQILPLNFDVRNAGTNDINWELFFVSIDGLVRESNKLLDIFDNLKAKYKDQMNFEKICNPDFLKNLDLTQSDMPSSYWMPVIEQQEKEFDKQFSEETSQSNECG